jgi:glycosyltransferase involved in cell wall biosynthesis
LRDFEWLVVDDGSTDGTLELIKDWANVADFPIRYFWQNHSGKHVAHNLAVKNARGKFFLPLDSDDGCVPGALERLAYHWETIPITERKYFAGIGGLSENQFGDIIGDQFPWDPFDATLRDRKYVYHLHGEKCGATLMEIVRQFPFPEIRETQFVPEGVVWLAIAKTHKIRNVNEVLRIYYVDDEETGATLTRRKGLSDNASGRLYYYVWLLNNDLEYFFYSPLPFLKAAVMLPIVGWYSRQPLRTALHDLNKASAKTLVLSLLPLASVLYALDRMTDLLKSRQKPGKQNVI